MKLKRILLGFILSVTCSLNGQTSLSNEVNVVIGSNSFLSSPSVINSGSLQGSGSLAISKELRSDSSQHSGTLDLIVNPFILPTILYGEDSRWSRIQINNPFGLKIESNVTIDGELILDGGDVEIQPGSQLIFEENAFFTDSDDNNRFSGQVVKKGVNDFTIPFKSNDVLGSISVKDIVDTTSIISVVFFDSIQTDTLLSEDLEKLDKNAFWFVSKDNTSEKINIEFNWQSPLQVSFDDLVLVHWNGAFWQEASYLMKSGDQNQGIISIETELVGYFAFAEA